jgi:hypothetical protein
MKLLKLICLLFIICFCLHKIIYTDIPVRVYKYKTPTKAVFIDRYNSRYDLTIDSILLDSIKRAGPDHILRKYDDERIMLIK